MPRNRITVKQHVSGLTLTEKRPGVIATIVALLARATETKPVTKSRILSTLVKRFPERGEDKMAATLNMQIPAGLRAEKGLEVHHNDKGYWLPTSSKTQAV